MSQLSTAVKSKAPSSGTTVHPNKPACSHLSHVSLGMSGRPDLPWRLIGWQKTHNWHLESKVGNSQCREFMVSKISVQISHPMCISGLTTTHPCCCFAGRDVSGLHAGLTCSAPRRQWMDTVALLLVPQAVQHTRITFSKRSTCRAHNACSKTTSRMLLYLSSEAEQLRNVEYE